MDIWDRCCASVAQRPLLIQWDQSHMLNGVLDSIRPLLQLPLQGNQGFVLQAQEVIDLTGQEPQGMAGKRLEGRHRIDGEDGWTLQWRHQMAEAPVEWRSYKCKRWPGSSRGYVLKFTTDLTCLLKQILQLQIVLQPGHCLQQSS